MVSRGLLMSFSDPVAGQVPSLLPFQYNPAEVTRVLRPQPAAGGGSGLKVAGPPAESYAFKMELDALGAIDKPITGTLGVAPLLATLESMLEPGGGGLAALIGAVAGALGGAGGGPRAVPSPTLPLVVLAWSVARVVPVRIDSCTVHETAFDVLLQPVQATVDLGFTVLRDRDLQSHMTLANVMAMAYQAVRKASATVGIAQGVELLL